MSLVTRYYLVLAVHGIAAATITVLPWPLLLLFSLAWVIAMVLLGDPLVENLSIPVQDDEDEPDFQVEEGPTVNQASPVCDDPHCARCTAVRALRDPSTWKGWTS